MTKEPEVNIKTLKMLKALDNPIRREIVEFILNKRGDKEPEYPCYYGMNRICPNTDHAETRTRFIIHIPTKVCIECIQSKYPEVKLSSINNMLKQCE